MTTYGLIGKTLSHSFSKKYFSKKFESEAISAQYHLFELAKIEDLRHLLHSEPELKGLNVTIPYKENIIPLLDEIDPEAAKIGAVNTVKITPDKTIGYNTDCFGFLKSLFPLLEQQHDKALILGTGGASKAVAQALTSLGITYKKVSRNPQKDQINYSNLTPRLIDDYHLIINCTPLGTYPNVKTAPDIPYNLLSTQHLLYDLTYNPVVTQFLANGQQQGCKIFNGQKMLEYQAERSWEIWQER